MVYCQNYKLRARSMSYYLSITKTVPSAPVAAGCLGVTGVHHAQPQGLVACFLFTGILCDPVRCMIYPYNCNLKSFHSCNQDTPQ